MILEVCVESVESSINAEAGGADRLELVGALDIGGITPGPGTIESVMANVTIPVCVMIRPRGGDFLYSDTDFDVMRRDIDFAGEAGVAGIVLGILLPDGRIDLDRTAYLIEYATPLPVTFHRAFDRSVEPMQALEDIIAAGAIRLLTSGQSNTAPEGVELLSRLVKAAGERLEIMPGAGLNENNIAEVARKTGAKNLHLTGRTVIESQMIFRRNEIGLGSPDMMSEEYRLRYTDRERIAAIKSIIKGITL